MQPRFDTAILLLIFNRPETTAQVFDTVRTVRPSRLYVAADGPRENAREDYDRCARARAATEAIDWDCQVTRLYRDGNLGCRSAVNSALDWFFGHEDEGIILEDDCLPSTSFFPFAQRLLSLYRNNRRIAMIRGTNYLRDSLRVSESYVFSRYFSVWGWASWKRVWTMHDKAMSGWDAFRSQGRLRTYYPRRFMQKHVRDTFDLAASGNIDTWDIQFSFSCLVNDMLAVVPRLNLVSNIGLSGTHTTDDARNHFLPVFTLDTDALVHPPVVRPDPRYDDVFFRREFGLHPLRWMRAKSRGALRRLNTIFR